MDVPNTHEMSEPSCAQSRNRTAIDLSRGSVGGRGFVHMDRQPECETSDALRDTLSLPDWVDELFGADKPTGVVDALIAERRQAAKVEIERVP